MASRTVPAEPAPAQTKPKMSVGQLRILLEAVEKDPWLYNAVQSDIITFLTIQKWKMLSDKLNECRGGATLDALNWKHALHCWADNVRKVNVMSKARLGYNKANRAITLKEAKELTRLERRFLNFLKNKEDNIEMGMYRSKIDAHRARVFPVRAINNENVCPGENVCPDGPKKRILHVKEDEPTDPAEVTKRLKVIFDENLALDDEEAENKQILAMTLGQLQMVSRELEIHIASIHRRINILKGVWTYRFSDN